jgi:transposase-like protein
MPAPLPAERRRAIADDIRAGMGRNEIARKHQVSPSTVTGIARDEQLHFENDWMTLTAVRCQQADAQAARAEREDRIIRDLLALPQTSRARDGRETKAYRRISYALYNVNRHHDRQHR